MSFSLTKRFLSYQETSDEYGIAIGTLYGLVSRRQIPHVRLGNRFVRFSREDLEEYFRQHQVQILERRHQPEKNGAPR